MEGKKFYLTCHLNSGKQPISFAWYHSDELVKPSENVAVLSTEESSQLITKEMRLQDAGQYVCAHKAENSVSKIEKVFVVKHYGKANFLLVNAFGF